jgi:hypothetical protein
MAKMPHRFENVLGGFESCASSRKREGGYRCSFDDPGALLIEKGETLDNETALLSAFVPSNTIH